MELRLRWGAHLEPGHSNPLPRSINHKGRIEIHYKALHKEVSLQTSGAHSHKVCEAPGDA